jgi:hypothetical protein
MIAQQNCHRRITWLLLNAGESGLSLPTSDRGDVPNANAVREWRGADCVQPTLLRFLAKTGSSFGASIA